jgi:hypothetical protein
MGTDLGRSERAGFLIFWVVQYRRGSRNPEQNETAYESRDIERKYGFAAKFGNVGSNRVVGTGV